MSDNDASRRPGHLWQIVQDYLDREDRSEAWFSRRIDAAPQTVSAWKLRGLRELPATSTLRNVARVTGVPYLRVLTAALLDVGKVDEDEAAQIIRPNSNRRSS